MADSTTQIDSGSGGPLVQVDNAGTGIAQYVKLYWGGSGTKNHVTEATPLPFQEPQLLIARGGVTGYQAVHKFGWNLDVDTGTDEDLWAEGGTWSDTAPTVAQTYNLASASADDAAAGTGARTVRVYGLDSSWELANEVVTLNGTTDVATSGSYWRIHRMTVESWGTGRENAGKITATGTTDANIMATIPTEFGGNSTEQAIYTIPDGHSGFMRKFYGGIKRDSPSGANCVLELKQRVADATLTTEGWRIRNSLNLSITAGASVREFSEPLIFNERTDIKLRVSDMSDNNSAVSGGFDLVLVPN